MSHLITAGGLGAVREFLGLKLPLTEPVFNKIVAAIAEAAKCHTYIETVAPSQADSWHQALRVASMGEWSATFTDFLAPRVRKLARRERSWLIIDPTKEPYYGVPTLDTVPYTGEDGVRAHWQFFAVALYFPRRRKLLPLVALHLPLGTSLASALGDALPRVLELVCRKPELMLMDRGFYTGAVIDVLERHGLKYLMLAPRNEIVGPMAAQCWMNKTWAVVEHEIKWTADKTTHRTPLRLVLWPDKDWDWAFATNLPTSQVRWLVARYRLRWNIETFFRVQDEARIKTKSRHAVVRLVTFLASLLLAALWALTDKRTPFKRWLIFLRRAPSVCAHCARALPPDG